MLPICGPVGRFKSDISVLTRRLLLCRSYPKRNTCQHLIFKQHVEPAQTEILDPDVKAEFQLNPMLSTVEDNWPSAFGRKTFALPDCVFHHQTDRKLTDQIA